MQCRGPIAQRSSCGDGCGRVRSGSALEGGEPAAAGHRGDSEDYHTDTTNHHSDRPAQPQPHWQPAAAHSTGRAAADAGGTGGAHAAESDRRGGARAPAHSGQRGRALPAVPEEREDRPGVRASHAHLSFLLHAPLHKAYLST